MTRPDVTGGLYGPATMVSPGPTVTLPVPAALSALNDGAIPARLADRVLILESPGTRGLWCTTKGLGGFGLPELQTLDVPLAIGLAWAHALNGIALRVVERWIEAIHGATAAFIEFPALIEFTVGDVARAYGVEDPGGGPSATVELRLDPAPDLVSDSFLTVGPPDGASGSVAAYLTRVCADLFGLSPP